MTSRRDFIKISALGAGILASGSGSYKILKALSSQEEVNKLVVDLKRTQRTARSVFGNVQAGYTRPLKERSGRSPEMTRISIATAGSVPGGRAVLVCIMTRTV